MFRTALISLFITSTAFATTWTVDDDGKADFDNIQAAVDAASDGDEIIVAPGTYTSTADEVVDMRGKEIWLHSSAGAEVTIIDGEGTRRGIYCNNNETVNTIIEGFTITNGYVGYPGGGGGMVIADSSPRIENCTFENNFSSGGGSAIWCSGGASPQIMNCILQDGQTDGIGETGGAIMCYGSGTQPTITDCTIRGNSGGRGGGVCSKTNANPHLVNCTITNNSTTLYGGGLTTYGGSMLLENCEITHNYAVREGGGAAAMSNGDQMVLIDCVISHNNSNAEGGGLFCDWNHGATPPSVTYSTICANLPNQYYGWGGPGETNYVDDVCDQDSDGIDDEIDNCPLYNPDQADCNGNGIGDICDINDLYSLDINGNEIPDECECLADVNADGTINLNDILTIIANWGSNSGLGDVNYDGIVDVSDLLIVIDNWGPCE